MQKFVITKEGEMRFGDVELHRQLLPWGDEDCYGGGYWEVSVKDKKLILHGCSYDFGSPQFEELKSVDYSFFGGYEFPLEFWPHHPYEEERMEISIPE